MGVIQGQSDIITPIHSKGRYFFKGHQRVSAHQWHYQPVDFLTRFSSSSSKAWSTAFTARDLLTHSWMSVWKTFTEISLYSSNWG